MQWRISYTERNRMPFDALILLDAMKDLLYREEQNVFWRFDSVRCNEGSPIQRGTECHLMLWFCLMQWRVSYTERNRMSFDALILFDAMKGLLYKEEQNAIWCFDSVRCNEGSPIQRGTECLLMLWFCQMQWRISYTKKNRMPFDALILLDAMKDLLYR